MPDDVVVLGIESTAHTFGAGLVSLKRGILANVRDVYIPEQGGIHPREAAEHHAKVAHRVIAEALSEAGLAIKEVSAIAVALGPGLGPCLRVGASVARALSLYFQKPLVPVNHAVAHIEIARYTSRCLDPLVIYVSGGNTIITAYLDGRYRVFGETLDIPLGNCLDVFAREVGLGLPGPPKIEELAKRAQKFIELPYAVKGQDLSFTGILTAALKAVKRGERLEDVCYSFVETVYSMLTEVSERALVHTKKREVVLTGGVARSPLLQEKIRKMCEIHGAKFAVVCDEYAGDNGAMIALTGLLKYMRGITIRPEDSRIKSRWRLDEVEVTWYKDLEKLMEAT